MVPEKTSSRHSVNRGNVSSRVGRHKQQRAAAVLTENKHYPNRKNDLRYLLRRLVKCAACSGHPTTTRGKTFHYYTCNAGRTNDFGSGRPHKPPYVEAG